MTMAVENIPVPNSSGFNAAPESCNIVGGFFAAAQNNASATDLYLEWQLQHFNWPLILTLNVVLSLIALKRDAIRERLPYNPDIPIGSIDTPWGEKYILPPDPSRAAIAGIYFLNIVPLIMYVVIQYLIL